MSKSYILDFDLLKEQNLSTEEFIQLININEGNQRYFIKLDKLEEKQFIKINDEDIQLREKGRLFLELISIDKVSFKEKKVIKKSSRLINEELDSFISEYRGLWKGKKPGSMGSEEACKVKMYRWMQENPKYSRDEILRAAKLYLNTLDNNTYLQRADYFIFKKDLGEESSRLSAFIEEIDEKPVTDWTTKLS